MELDAGTEEFRPYGDSAGGRGSRGGRGGRGGVGTVVDKGCRLHVKNIPSQFLAKEEGPELLKEALSSAGTITRVTFFYDHTDRLTGSGMVTFANIAAAKQALAMFEGSITDSETAAPMELAIAKEHGVFLTKQVAEADTTERWGHDKFDELSKLDEAIEHNKQHGGGRAYSSSGRGRSWGRGRGGRGGRGRGHSGRAHD